MNVFFEELKQEERTSTQTQSERERERERQLDRTSNVLSQPTNELNKSEEEYPIRQKTNAY